MWLKRICFDSIYVKVLEQAKLIYDVRNQNDALSQGILTGKGEKGDLGEGHLALYLDLGGTNTSTALELYIWRLCTFLSDLSNLLKMSLWVQSGEGLAGGWLEVGGMLKLTHSPSKHLPDLAGQA